MESKISRIAGEYFNAADIESVKVNDKRIIVTLRNGNENSDKDEALKQQLSALAGERRISVIHTGEKAAPSLKPEEEKWLVPGVKKIIAVASGKGGVGKSTTSVNLALALAQTGLKTALFDADIYGPSVPTMLGYEGVAPVSYDGKTFEPFQYLGIKSMSIGTLIDKDVPLIWRGAKACGAIQQLLTEVNWGGTDVLVIDMPPGTGDIQITLSQKLDFAGAVIVSTPQDIALIDAVKGVNMFKKVNVPILGIVENMSYYICEHCGARADIFGHEGARKTAEKLGETFLGEIPLHIAIRENSDAGTPVVYSMPGSAYANAYLAVARQIKEKLGF